MATKILQITPHLHVTPLLDIQHPSFAKFYRDGVYWSLFQERCTAPLSDSYMLKNIRACLRVTDVEGQKISCLPTIGFHLGRLHGAILSERTGQPRSNIITLAHFEHDCTRRGYGVGREWYFVDSLFERPNDRTYNDVCLLEHLQEIERDSVYFHEEEDTWYYALGCILGELSSQLFPATTEESAHWEAECLSYQMQAS